MNRLFKLFFFSLVPLLTACAPLGSSTTPSPTSSPAAAAHPTSTTDLASTASQTGVFFDDFSYQSRDEMTARGWILRLKAGWPGINGAAFDPHNVRIIDDPALPGNRLMRMISSTDGTPAGTSQTQVCQQRKFLYGTYAARVRFSDAPAMGPNGDQVVETFYAITPLLESNDRNYSEMDFEYLPNGGWGGPAQALHVTSWQTASTANNVSNYIQAGQDGWHTLVLQAEADSVRYFIDGALIASHPADYAPDAPMSLNFNLWFIQGGLLSTNELRAYAEDVDWTFYQACVSLDPAEVLQRVTEFRQRSTTVEDTVPPADPPLPSPCDL